eukprot:snap_masked-scaffold_3-processed-gene-20.4-mRNA-1 protein AED:1.00 eAED:1.00 QI:0/-1/0/0/-1/1/1/0/329
MNYFRRTKSINDYLIKNIKKFPKRKLSSLNDEKKLRVDINVIERSKEVGFDKVLRFMGNSEKDFGRFMMREAKIGAALIAACLILIYGYKSFYHDKLPVRVKELLKETEELQLEGDFFSASQKLKQAKSIMISETKFSPSSFGSESVLKIHYLQAENYQKSNEKLLLKQVYKEAIGYIQNQIPNGDLVARKWKSFFYERLGDILLEQGDFSDAENMLISSLASLLSKNDVAKIVAILNSSRVDQIETLNSEELKSLSDFNQVGKEFCAALNSLGILYWSWGNTEQAKNTFLLLKKVLQFRKNRMDETEYTEKLAHVNNILEELTQSSAT